MNNKKFWSKSGIILGIILGIISVLLSTVAYNDPAIRHPEGFSDFKIIAYPNALLGFPATFLSFPMHRLVSSHYDYKIQFYSSIPNDDLNNQKIQQANSKTLDDRYQTNLFIDLFIILTIYWFFIGTLLAWIYNKFSKRNKIFLVGVLLLIIFCVMYISLVTINPRPFNPQAELDKMMQGK